MIYYLFGNIFFPKATIMSRWDPGPAEYVINWTLESDYVVQDYGYFYTSETRRKGYIQIGVHSTL